jgi:HlyD family secretion protein
MKNKKLFMYGGIGMIVLLTIVYFVFLRGSKLKYDFRFDKVTQGDLNVYVTATGTINPVTSVDVGTQVSGIVSKLYADYNSVVRKGQLIAQIDTTFLVQAVKDAEASMDRARAQFADSKRTLDRTQALFERQLASQSDLDVATTAYEVNNASLKSAQASLDRARINLAYANIYAPIDGVVINRAVNFGQTVAASFSSPTLFTIANDLRKMQVQTTVDETDIGRVSIGQAATFTVDAYPDDKFVGNVSQIRLAPTTVSNVVNYIVIIDVDNSDLKLMPGMTANVKLLIGSSSNVLRVSNIALRFQPPADIIDTAKIQHRGGGMAGGQVTTNKDSERAGDNAVPQTGNVPTQGSGMGSGFGEGGRERFRAIRDSINKAHGGEMSRDEIRAEMQKIFVKMAMPNKNTKKQTPVVQRRTRTTFGITQTFPEYEKSIYEPNHQSGFGKVWILNASGKLEPVYVHTGLNDGKFTEITSPTLKAGDQIVTAANSPDDNTQKVSSPLTGQGQGIRMGGGGGGR